MFALVALETVTNPQRRPVLPSISALLCLALHVQKIKRPALRTIHSPQGARMTRDGRKTNDDGRHWSSQIAQLGRVPPSVELLSRNLQIHCRQGSIDTRERDGQVLRSALIANPSAQACPWPHSCGQWHCCMRKMPEGSFRSVGVPWTRRRKTTRFLGPMFASQTG